MTDVIGEAFVAIRPDTKGFTAETESGVKGALTKIGAAVGGFFVASKVTDVLKSSFSEAQESIKVGKQTEAVIKSTGRAAHVTAGDVGDLANSLSKKAGIDDEVIQAGENMLLTFRGIRNETGKGNDIFNQATKASLDLAVAMKGQTGGVVDLKGASILLGKALNDPLQGMTALRRVGVQLSAQDQQTVKDLVAQGKLREAQKVILAEVTKEFGGSAAAQATAADKANVAWKNLQESIGKLLIPVVSKLADIVTPLMDYLSEHQGVLLAIAGVIGGALVAAFIAWAAAATSAAVATIAATWPVIAVAVAIGALTAAIILLWTHWDEIWGWMKDHPAYAVLILTLGSIVTGGLLPIVLGAVWLAKNWDDVWAWVKGAVHVAWGFIKPIFDAVVSALGVIVWAAGIVKGVWDGFFDGVRDAWNSVGKPIFDALIGTLQTVAGLWNDVKSFVTGSSGNINDVPPAQRAILKQLGYGATGAVVTRPTLSVIGEAGPEAVIPLSRMPGASPLPDAAPAAPTAGGLTIQGDLVIHQGEDAISKLDYWAQTRMAGV